MDSKNIVIAARFFYPEIGPRSFRTTELAKELAKQGHNVTVLIHKKDIDYSVFEQEHNLNIEDFVKGKWTEFKLNNFFKKVLYVFSSYLFYYPDIQYTFFLRKYLKKYSNIDLMISIANPFSIHWGVALAKKDNIDLCKTWVADCGDPFMGNKETKFTHAFYFKYIEKWFCSKPNYLSIPIEEAKEAYPEECRSRIKIIPQGFNFEETLSFFKDKEPNDIITFAYAGALSKGKRDPSQFLDYLCTLNSIPFKFIVYTQERFIEPYKKKLGDKLDLRVYVPRSQLLEELSTVDFLVNIENIFEIQRPSKLIDYALLDIPVLSIKPFKLDISLVEQFLKRDYSNRLVIDNINQYDIKNIAKEFINLSESKTSLLD